ncbi:hypothetical protein MRX96_047083 [Rhipicephalus microplus]
MGRSNTTPPSSTTTPFRHQTPLISCPASSPLYCTLTVTKFSFLRHVITSTRRSKDDDAGLTLTLDVQPQDYLPTSTAMGFLVMVHGRGFRADACANSVFAQPGYITYIGLIQRRRAALPEPYQPSCRDTWPSRLKYYLQNTTRYTREVCSAF